MIVMYIKVYINNHREILVIYRVSEASRNIYSGLSRKQTLLSMYKWTYSN